MQPLLLCFRSNNRKFPCLHPGNSTFSLSRSPGISSLSFLKSRQSEPLHSCITLLNSSLPPCSWSRKLSQKCLPSSHEVYDNNLSKIWHMRHMALSTILFYLIGAFIVLSFKNRLIFYFCEDQPNTIKLHFTYL